MTDNSKVQPKASDLLALFRKEANFVAGADKSARLPKYELPEFAFIGKSNVGKSSSVNLLCNRKTLARVSHTPGRTQQINFFQVGSAFILVDLPGYGFAKVAYNLRKSWEELILQYLSKRDNLKVINLLIDARRGIMDHDKAVIQLLQDMERNFQIVFTKSDKISDRLSIMEASNKVLTKSVNFIFTSSRSKMARKNCSLVWQNTSEPELPKPKLRTSEQAGLISLVLQRSSDLESETIVIKLPARVIEDADLLRNAVDNIALLKMTGANIIVVHDHTNLVYETLELFGIDKKTFASFNITDHKTSQIVEMVLSGHINKKIVSQICAAGCQAIGISGKDGDLIEAKKQSKGSYVREGLLEFGFVSEPATVNPEILMNLCDSGFVTVISPVAFGKNGETYLLDASITSSIIASVTAARHLILLTQTDKEIAAPGEYLLSELRKIYAIAPLPEAAGRYLGATISALENSAENVHLIDAGLKDAILLSVFGENEGMRVTLE